MTNKSTFDAIIVLGGGRTNDGDLTTLSMQRLDKGAQLYKEGLANKVFALGGQYSTYSPLAICFDKSGADVRADYLIEQGVPPESIIKVENGRDTIGEAFAVRSVARDLELSKLALVTSDKHLERSLFLFRRIFGEVFSIEGVGVPCGDLLNEAEEKEYLGIVKRFFLQLPKDIPDPDLETWFTDHPELYAEYKKVHDEFHPPGQESQAYMGVRKEVY